MAAMSAIDIAIWDLMGKLVFKLLGGCTKEKIRVYDSKIYSGPIEVMQKEAEEARVTGHNAYKMRFGWGPQNPLAIAANLQQKKRVTVSHGFSS